MFTRVFIWVGSVLLIIAWPLLAQGPSTTQPSDDSILWQQTYTLRERPEAVRLATLPGGGYRIVGKTSWTKDSAAKINDRYGFEFFVLDVDRQGCQVALETFESIPRRREQVRDAVVVGDGWVVAGATSWLGWIDAKGRLQREVELRGEPKVFIHPCCLLPLTQGRFLVGGSPGYKDAWVGEVDADGRVIWEETFDRGADEAVHAMVARPDGGFVFLATSGKFDKFGQGPSTLWLVSCDARGRKEHEAVLPDGRLMPGGHPVLVGTGDGYALAFSRSGLPGITNAGGSGPAFSRHIALFDQELRLRWEKGYPPTGSMWSLLVARPGGELISIGGASEGLSISRISAEGELLAETRVPLSGILSWPIDVIADADTLTILVKGVLESPDPTGSPSDVVRLVRIRL